MVTGEFWFLFPLAIVIAIFAMATGVSGANFWVPTYLLWLQLDAHVGFWLSLATMICGFSSGLVGHFHQGTINFFLVRRYLVPIFPAVVLGALVVPYIQPYWLFLAFSVFTFTYASWVLRTLMQGSNNRPPSNEHIYWGVAALGGFLTGLITVGLGKLLLPYCLRHRRCQSPGEAVGTTVTLVFLASLVAALTRLTPSLMTVLRDEHQQLMNILVFVVPGVILGGQLGPRVAHRLSLTALRSLLVLVLYLVSGLMFIRFWFTVQ